MTRPQDRDRRPTHRRPSRTPTHRPPADHDAPRSLTDEFASALAADHPIDLLAQTSGLLAVFDERQPAPDAPPRRDFLAALTEVDAVETTAILTVWQHLTPNDLERLTIGRTLASRRHHLPSWLSRFDEVRVGGVLLVQDDTGETEQYMLELVWPDDIVLTLAALIDVTFGHVLVDALVVPEPLARLVELAGVTVGLTVTTADPAEARARVQGSVDRAAAVEPSIETESWPMARPLLEWALRLLPAGGTDYPVVDEPAWSIPSVLGLLADRVGGRDVLDSLDTVPLPDEPFGWTGIPHDIHPKVGAALTLFDEIAGARFGVEFRTAGRRLLARVAATRPDIFRRRASDATAACAVALLVAGMNGERVTQKSIAADFGLTGAPSSRVATFSQAARESGWSQEHNSSLVAGWPSDPDHIVQLGLLTAAGRQRLIETRDFWREREEP